MDVRAARTSIGIYNVRDDSTEIHYNKLNSNDLAGRRTVLFRPNELTCDTQQISKWQFAELRRVALDFYKVKDLGEKYVDVPIGPSLLLYAVQSHTERFKFVKSIVSRTLMSNVNVYKLQITGVPASQIFRNLLIVLHVSTVGQRRGLHLGDSLKGALLDGAHLDVKFFGVCHLETKVRSADGGKEPAREELWDEDNFCRDGADRRFLFKVHFDIIEQLTGGTLVGKQLDQFEREPFDLAREPFLQPVGIGCWASSVNLGRRSNLLQVSRATGGVLMSAAYVTSHGLKGLSYVAYDEVGRLLRLDRDGRKSIFDLASGQSYHVGEQSSSTGLTSELLQVLATENCMVLGMERESSLVQRDTDIMLQLLGLGSNATHYLGTRTIEHEQYEVYENSFANFHSESPILLRTKPDGPMKPDDGLTFYITYYLQPNGLIRYVELYSFEAPVRRRKLINRLEFVQFSWSLEVEPADDPQSQASDSNLRLFQMEACQQNRAHQTQVVVSFESGHVDGSPRSSEQLAKGLRHYKQELTGKIQRWIAESLRVSIMNVADLKLGLESVERNGKMLAAGRVASLRSSVVKLQALGSTYMIDDGHVRQTTKLRFSLDECLLDALELRKASRFAYCPQLAGCVVLEADTDSDLELIPGGRNQGDGACQVYTLKYAAADRSGTSSYMAEINQRYLDGQTFEFELGPFQDEDTGQLRPGFTYKARTDLRDFVRMDVAVGAGHEQAANLDLLSGLRYTTRAEEPQALNANVRVALGKPMREADRSSLFAHCQLSCQLDEFCGSFSMCHHSKRTNANECVLSTVRLTGERIEQILAAASRIREGETRFLVNITSEISSQALDMHRDDACSLHPREFAPDFMLFKSVERVSEDDSHQELESRAQKLESVRPRDQMTFEQCAGLSFERTFGCESIKQTNFTYCPLDSLCIVEGDDVKEQLELASGPCRSYERHTTRFYLSMRATHMRVVGVKATSSPDETIVNDMAKSKDDHLVRSFWGVAEGDCARECSLHKSECLAFDTCRNQGKVLCILYSVRSPLSRRGAYLPLLEREQKLVNEGGVTLFGSRICDHFYLKPAHFEVRLKNLLARQDVASTPSDESEYFPEEIKALEDKIEANNEKSDQEDLLAVADFKTIVDNYERASETSPMEASSSQSLVHWLELTIGLLIGCVLTIYKQEVTRMVLIFYRGES